MSKPNRVLANLPKNPFELLKSFRTETAADEFAAEQRAKGLQVKVTRMATGSRKKTVRVYNVWVRPL